MWDDFDLTFRQPTDFLGWISALFAYLYHPSQSVFLDEALTKTQNQSVILDSDTHL
jgi:hypothetical protein